MVPASSPPGLADPPPSARAQLLYYFCRMQLPAVVLAQPVVVAHLQRTRGLASQKVDGPMPWEEYFAALYPRDWYVAAGCLEGNGAAWDVLFASRAGRSDCLLTDALRARAVRLYPRNEERQDGAVQEFWGHLCVSDHPGSLPVLARFDGLRPLVPWLIRVFQNWHISQLRKHTGVQALPDDDLALPLPGSETDSRWRDAFILAVRAWLETLEEKEVLLLGLRTRYRLSQREVAHLLQIHEGTVSRLTDQLRNRCLAHVSKRLLEEGWTGDDLSELVRGEMFNLLLDEPRLSADALAQILARRGKALPA